jgi:hypothetical protein
MEQYWMPKKLDWKNLRLCLDNYTTSHLFIRLVGSRGGTVKVSEPLEGKKLDFKRNKSGLYMLIDGNEAFHFPLRDYQKGFSVGYERIETLKNGVKRFFFSPEVTELDPYDPRFPEPSTSMLRTVLDYHLMEISFDGRIDLKFHSWWIKPYWKYWSVVKPKKKLTS